MKKRCFILALLVILVLAQSVSAEEVWYDFELSANGGETVEVSPGDVVTVMLRLRRENTQEPYPMYGMQAELRYDGTFLEVVEDASTAYTGVSTMDIALEEDLREYYMNFLSLSGGTSWEPETLIGTVQFRVTGTSGVSKLTNQDYLVSLPDGSGSYEVTSNELLFVVSTDCTVTFRTNGGSELAPVIVQFGEKLPRPTDPIREGYHLVGWYTDIHLTDEWDFEEDVVESNLTLYAKWEVGAPPAAPAEPGPSLVWWLLLAVVLFTVAYIWWDKNKPKKEKP